MNKKLILLILFFGITNFQLNAERKSLESAKQSKNISRSEFLPSITLSGDQRSSTATNRTNQSGAILSDTNSDSESKTFSIEQKIFSGFKGLNTFKKSELETKKAELSLKKVEQQTILNSASAYFDLIFKSKNENFNLSNINLFERQVESDSARLQKGEITLTDLAQSESSLAGANANLIKAQTEFLASQTNFERITREKIPDPEMLSEQVNIILPETLKIALDIAKLKNLDLLIAKLDYQIAVKKLNIEKAKLSPSAAEDVVMGVISDALEEKMASRLIEIDNLQAYLITMVKNRIKEIFYWSKYVF